MQDILGACATALALVDCILRKIPIRNRRRVCAAGPEVMNVSRLLLISQSLTYMPLDCANLPLPYSLSRLIQLFWSHIDHPSKTSPYIFVAMALGPFSILFISLAAAAFTIAASAAIYRTMNPEQFSRLVLPFSDSQRAYLRDVRLRTQAENGLVDDGGPQRPPRPPMSPMTTQSTDYQSTRVT